MNRFLRFVPLLRLVRLAVLAMAIAFWLALAPVFAQDNHTALIILDGRPLFEVSQSGRYSAEARAEDANRVLEQTVETSESPASITIDETQDLPIIKVDSAHLLTVTEEDAPPGRTVKEQAQIWAGRLEGAIRLSQKQRSSSYIQKAILLSIGCVLLAIALSWGLGWIWRRWLQPRLPVEVREADDSRQHLTIELAVRILFACLRVAMWVFVALYITNLFPQTRELSRQVRDILVGSLVSELIPLGDTSYSFLDLLILLGLFTGLVVLARTAKKLLRSRVLRLTGLNRGSQETVAQIATYGIIFFGTMVMLQLWGLNLSSLTIFASVIGVGIGLGLQGIAKEFISGLVLIFERPIKVGDFINVGELMGTVERISVRSTEIRTLDEVSIIVPNSRFLEAEVINWTHHSPISRLRIPISVAYGSSLTAVRSALVDAAKEHADVLAEPAPKVFFIGMGESALDFNLMVWIAEPRKQLRIKSDLYFRIEATFRHRDIEIPFSQHDLHVRSGSLPLEVPPDLTDSLAQLSTTLVRWLEKQSDTTPERGNHDTLNNRPPRDREH